MKKYIGALLLCVLCLLGGCTQKKEQAEAPVPTVQIAQAAYQYDQGYSLSEGWMYEMTLSSEKQIAELDGLVNAADFQLTGQDFMMGHGYRIIWYDAAGNVTRDMLILSEKEASMDGMLYKLDGAQPLYQWLDGLRMDEQTMAD